VTEDQSEKALQKLADAARRDEVPDLDWGAVESKLLARISSGERPLVTLPRRRSWVVPAALAAFVSLAAGALLLRPTTPHGLGGSRNAANSTLTPAGHGEILDGDGLSSGAVVTSGDQAVVVRHVDHVTWTLAPSSLAHVEAVGDVVALSLDKGTLSATVTKSKRPESFVVRVEKSRIAVHGTAFRIDRLEKSVRVDVTEGVVAIGPVGGKSFELPAPGSVVVSFDGLRSTEVAPSSTPAARSAGAAAAVPSRPNEAGAPLEADATTKNAPESNGRAVAGHAAPAPSEGPGVERVIQAVRRCLSENTVAGGDLRVSVRTRLSLRVQATGHVGEVLFDPPLAPAVQACVGARVGSIGFVASHDGFALERVIELER
jgi:hypothetical protein